jgi:hypothetical protein
MGSLRRERSNAQRKSLFVTADTIIAGASVGANSVLAIWRSFNPGARNLLARFKTTPCDECSRPVRWWNRRIWVVNGERCAHLQCWNGQLFLKAYVQLMAEEIRLTAGRRTQPGDNDAADTELRELRASARALRERAERLEAQLQQAEELAAKMHINGARNNGKQSTRVRDFGSLRPGPAPLRRNE